MYNDDRTKIRRPTPGRRRRRQSRYTPPPSYTPVMIKGLNPLVDAAGTLLSLASQLSTQAHDPGVVQLREQIGAEVQTFVHKAREHGIDAETINNASYALCAFLDEVVMETPWGGDSFWLEKPLLVEFHGDTWGGEKFFEILQDARDDPSRNLDLLEVMYLCLAFGFEGTYKIVKQHEVERIRQDLYAQIRRHRGVCDPELSPHWQGVEKRGTLIRHIPLWLVGVVMFASLVMTYIGFRYEITNKSYPVDIQLQNIKPKLMLVNLPDLEDPPPPPEPKPFDGEYRSYILKFITRGDRLTSIHKEVLQKFIDRVNANGDYNNIGVRIIGRASPTPPGADVYNQRLSEQRAQSVRRYLKGRRDYKLPTVKIISVEGLGAYREPLLPRDGYNETYNEINQSVQVLVVSQEKE